MDYYREIEKRREALANALQFRETQILITDPGPELDAEIAAVDVEIAGLRTEIEGLEADQTLYQAGYDAGNTYHMRGGPIPSDFHGANGAFRRGFESAGQDS